MADIVINQALGRIRTFADNAAGGVANAAFILVLLQAAEADGTIRDYDDLAALLGAAGNTEATFTNYARKTISGASITVTVDDTNDRVDIDVPDQTWTSAGGVTNNTLTDALFCYDADTTVGTDANITPMSLHDFPVTTDGSDITLQVAAAGLLRAS